MKLPFGKRKYRNKPVESDGLKFDSTGEFNRWVELRLLEKASEISNLRLHPKYTLTAHGSKICDFVLDYHYRDKAGHLVVEDHKQPATITPVFKLKCKLLRAQEGIEVRVVGKGMGR